MFGSMPRIILVSATLLGACVSFTAWAGGPPQAKTLLLVAELTDDEIAGQLIKQSIAVYPGSCPCPYHADRRGALAVSEAPIASQVAHHHCAFDRTLLRKWSAPGAPKCLLVRRHLEYQSSLDHQRDLLQSGDVVKGISRHRDQVAHQAGLERTDAIGPAHIARRD